MQARRKSRSGVEGGGNGELEKQEKRLSALSVSVDSSVIEEKIGIVIDFFYSLRI